MAAVYTSCSPVDDVPAEEGENDQFYALFCKFKTSN